MTETAVKPIPEVDLAQLAAIATALKAAGWNEPYFHDGKLRRTGQLAHLLVQAGVRMPAAMATPDWTTITKILLDADASLVIALELLPDSENRIARVIRLAFEEGMHYVGKEFSNG